LKRIIKKKLKRKKKEKQEKIKARKEKTHARYFKASLKAEKGESNIYKALIKVSSAYPAKQPLFKLSLEKSYQKKFSIPVIYKDLCNPEALSFAQKEHSKKNDINLKLIEIELNLNYESFLQGDVNYLISCQMRKLKMCLDIVHDINKKGSESSVAKVLGKAHRGKDRRICFSQNEWNLR